MRRRKLSWLLAVIAADLLMLAGALLFTLDITARLSIRPSSLPPSPITWLALLLIVGGLYARAYVWAFWSR